MFKRNIVEFEDGSFAVRSLIPGLFGWTYLDSDLYRGGYWWPLEFVSNAKVESLDEARYLYSRYKKLKSKRKTYHTL